jgi:hypothetical protein
VEDVQWTARFRHRLLKLLDQKSGPDMFTAPPWWLFQRECKLSLRHIPQPLPTKPTVHGLVAYLLKTWGSIECAYIVHLLYVHSECTLLYRAARSGKAVDHIHGGFVWYIPVCIKPHCDELLSTTQTRHGPRIHDPNIVVFHGIFCRCQPHMSVEEREKRKQWDDATSGDMRRPAASALWVDGLGSTFFFVSPNQDPFDR